ncbi:MAG TPA: hypothetical protein VJA16_14865 [Thermoanaerobaculia bacterium]
MTRPRPAKRLIITLPPEVIRRLRNRGARSDRHHGPYNYTRQLSRALGLFDAVVLRSDPRETGGLDERPYGLIVDLLRDPHRLETFHISRLGEYLLELPDFGERAHAIGCEPEELARSVSGLTFAEKLHLVDSAQLRHSQRPRTIGSR